MLRVTKEKCEDMNKKLNHHFSPCLDILVQKYDPYIALLWGKIWTYEQSDLGYCHASYQILSKELNISRRKIISSIKILLADNLIIDISPNKFNVEGTARRYKTNLESLDKLEASALKALPSALKALPSASGALASALNAPYYNSNINSSLNDNIDVYSNSIIGCTSCTSPLDYIHKIEEIVAPIPVANDEYWNFAETAKNKGIPINNYWDLKDIEKLKIVLDYCENYKKEKENNK